MCNTINFIHFQELYTFTCSVPAYFHIILHVVKFSDIHNKMHGFNEQINSVCWGGDADLCFNLLEVCV